MSDPMPNAPCADCYDLRLDRGDPAVMCGDCFFERFGDMLTPNELRCSELRNPDNALERDKWLAEYQAAGVGDTQDPSAFTLLMRVSPGETHEDLAARVVDAAVDVTRVRFSTPQEF